MKENFSEYYRLSDEEMAEAWKSGVIVVDTNVLLGLYRFNRTTRKALIKVLQVVSDRLWIPHQVALEFQENRLGVIDDQVAKFDDVHRVLDDAKRTLVSGLEKLELETRHSLIDVDEFLEDVGRSFDEFARQLNALKKEQPDVHDTDALREIIDELFAGKVGSAPATQDDLEKIYKEGLERYKHKQPPGYSDLRKRDELADRNKATSYFHQGKMFDIAFGDLILWKELIEKVKTQAEWNHVIFVTSDRKEDWWWTVRRSGTGEKMRIGPRPELVAEIMRQAEIASFIMYEPVSFMRDAAVYLGVQVDEESVKQVGDVFEAVERERRRKEVSIRRIFPVTNKYFDSTSDPQEIVIEFTNQTQGAIRVHGVHYSDAGGLPISALRQYPWDDRRRLIVYSNTRGAEIPPGETFSLGLELAAKWEPADINRWAGNWGYLRMNVTLENEVGEFEGFYPI